MKIAAVSLACLILAGCSVTRVQTHKPVNEPRPHISQVFDCLRENNLALVSAHRGQKDPLAAENSLSSFEEVRQRGAILMEIDIARTADGELILMHDDRLDRTTTGTGPVINKSFQEIRRLKLKDGKGRILDEQIPTLDEALTWARRTGTLLQLDLKRGVAVQDVVRAVRRTRTERQVILIAYNPATVRRYRAAAPDMLVSGSANSAAQMRELLKGANQNLLVFTGLSEPSPALIRQLHAKKVEAITGTLGAPGKRLDDIYMADGDGSEYAALAAKGVSLIASDRPIDAYKALKSARRSGDSCVFGEKR